MRTTLRDLEYFDETKCIANTLCLRYRNNPSQLDPINAPFKTVLSSPNNALLSAVCSQPEITSFRVGVESVAATNQYVSIQCTMSKSFFC